MIRVLLSMLFALGLSLPLVGCRDRERETEIETPAGEAEIERETDQPDAGRGVREYQPGVND